MKPTPPPPKPHRIAILLAGLAAIVGFVVPGLKTILLPLTYLNVLFHEMSHAVAGLLSGGLVRDIHIDASGSGATNIDGGSLWLIGPAGYVGASLIGAAIIWFSRSEKSARNVLRGLAVLVGIGAALWVRSDAIGVGAAIFWVGALFAAGTFLKGLPLLLTAQFVGLQQCLNSLTSVYVLMNLSTDGVTRSDAFIMEGHTHIPAIAWALGWCILSFTLIALSLTRAWISPVTTGESPRSDP